MFYSMLLLSKTQFHLSEKYTTIFTSNLQLQRTFAKMIKQIIYFCENLQRIFSSISYEMKKKIKL